MYILTSVLRHSIPGSGPLAAIAYAWSSYDPVIIVVGHQTKMLPSAMRLGDRRALLIFQRRYFMGRGPAGGVRFRQISTQHMQVVLYPDEACLMTLGYLVHMLREKKVRMPSCAGHFRACSVGIASPPMRGILCPCRNIPRKTMREMNGADE